MPASVARRRVNIGCGSGTRFGVSGRLGTKGNKADLILRYRASWVNTKMEFLWSGICRVRQLHHKGMPLKKLRQSRKNACLPRGKKSC